MKPRLLPVIALLALTTLPALARDDDRYEEIREFTLPADRTEIVVDGGRNGGAAVYGWDKDEILVRAKIRIDDRRVDNPAELASRIEIELGNVIRARGPRDRYSVSFEVYAPRHSNLRLTANNGGVHVEDVTGDMELHTTNGGLHLTRIGGNVVGRATNGGLHVELAGDRWDGEKLDATTTNGGVHLRVPDGYSARLETGTVNGGIDINFPVTVSGRLTKQFTTVLGEGGPTVRVQTTNGGVQIRRG